jgi:uncharacterized membrane-anchored protein
MNRKFVVIGLALAIVAQTAVLASVYLGAVYPLWTGQEIRLETRPVDPRSIFRGNYARLRYEVQNLPASAFDNFDQLRQNEVVYVSLKPDDAGLHVFDRATLEKPQQGVFLRGRLNKHNRNGGPQVRFDNIDAWFAPKKEALRLERELASSAVAVVMVADNGKATLKAIEPAAEGS